MQLSWKQNERLVAWFFIVSGFIWAPLPAFLCVQPIKTGQPASLCVWKGLCNHWRRWVRLLPVCFRDRWWATGRTISRLHNRRLDQACDVTWQQYYQPWQLRLCASTTTMDTNTHEPNGSCVLVTIVIVVVCAGWDVVCRDAVTLPKVPTPRWACAVVCEANECCITEHHSSTLHRQQAWQQNKESSLSFTGHCDVGAL